MNNEFSVDLASFVLTENGTFVNLARMTLYGETHRDEKILAFCERKVELNPKLDIDSCYSKLRKKAQIMNKY